jgi:hypothetical protein
VTLVDLEVSAHLAAVRDHLAAGGILTAIGRKPEGGGWVDAPGQSDFTPYVVLWRVGAQESRNMMMTVEHTEARPSIQATCAGGWPDQVDELRDQVDERMLNGSLAVPGRVIQRVVYEVGITTAKDADEAPPVFFGGSRFRVWTLPGSPAA